MADDLEIIESVLQGETERYGELVTRYQEPAWRLAYSFVGNAEEARDLSQNSFFKAYQNLARFRRSAKFSTWLYRIIANECKDYFRRKVRRPQTVSVSSAENDPEDPALFDPADPKQDPRQAMADREFSGRLFLEVSRLSAQQRTAFLLHRVDGLPLEEVAAIMECRAGTVKAHLFRANQTLQVLLKPFWTMEVE